MAGRTGWRTTAVSISEDGALAAGGSHQLRPRLAMMLLAGAAFACIATLALLTLFASTPPSAHRLTGHPRAQSHPPATLPASLAPTASSSIGASERSFWPARHGASLLASAGGLHSTFTAGGVRMRVAQGSLELSLAALGRGARVERIAPVAPRAVASEVLYRHPSVTEFYRNGPYGLEQGFTLPSRPSAGAGSLVLSMRLAGSLIPRQAGSEILFRTATGATALRYGQLSAVDATGRRLPAHIQIRNRTLQLQIDDRKARYPLRIDPFIQQGEKLTDAAAKKEEIGAANFGESVALSADGKTALIGGPSDNANVGAVWVFTFAESKWTQQGPKLLATGETGSGHFGESVALDAKGETALIGGGGDNGNLGAAWVFTRSGTTWTQQAKLLPTAGQETGAGNFGASVALPKEGNTALVGAPGDNTNVGAAWVFTRSSGIWSQQAKLLPTAGQEIGEGRFGESVALDAELGNIALIGAPEDNGRAGAAWVFTRSGTAWTQQGAKLVAKELEEIGDAQFGASVALSAEKAEKPTALIGAPFDGEESFLGAAWVFTRTSSVWTQQGVKLTAKEGEESGDGFFGESVALSSLGTTALIGGPADDGLLGAAWVFTRVKPSEILKQHGEKLTGGAESGAGHFGERVALAAEKGETALIGGPADNANLGAAWAFVSQKEAAPKVVTEQATAVTPTSATLNAKVNPNGGKVTACKFEYGTTISYGKTAACTTLPGEGEFLVPVSASVTGLTNTIYHFRISATNTIGTTTGNDVTFTATPPAVVTQAASAIATTSATLNATVNPNGAEVGECIFEYGTTTEYDSAASCTPSPGSGTSPVAVSASISGLAANTTYHFRISAANTGGTSLGSDVTFTTAPKPPAVVTTTASSVNLTSATLNATVNPNGGEVGECVFEYGTTTAYGSTAACAAGPGSGTSPVAVSAPVAGLTAHTLYHFRISASNPGGASKGPDRTFITANPRYVSNGALLGATPRTSIEWGTITLRAAKGGIPGSFVTCHSAQAGTLFNPAGGGAGEGTTQVLATFACEAELVCPFGLSTALVPKELPWHNLLIEEVAGSIRQETTGLRLTIECLAGETVESEEEYVVGPGEKGLRPTFKAGTSALHPGFSEFGEGSGEVEVEGSGGGVARKVEGIVKVLGYNAQELISTK
jgi:hypothetical protein